MTTKGITQLKDFLSQLLKKIKPTSVELKAVGEEAVYLIRKRTRLGYGVINTGDPKKSLKSMRKHNKNYTIFRKAFSSLSDKTNPTKHNLTLTGELLDELKVTKVDASKAKIGFGGKKRSASENVEIAEKNIARGWKFLNLSKAELSQLQRFYGNQLQNRVRNIRASKS